MSTQPGHSRSVRPLPAVFVVAIIAAGFLSPIGTSVARASAVQAPARARAGTPTTAEPVNCSPADSAGELPPGTQSIAGLVTDGSGQPVADIEVRVALASAPDGNVPTFTNAAGEYLMGSLGSGTYLVSFYDSTGTYQSGFYDAGPTVLTPDLATPITLDTIGTNATGKNAMLAAETLHSMSGVVTDNLGIGVQGALVRASGVYFPLVGCFATDDTTGSYAVPDLRAGVYEVSVQADAEPFGFYEQATHFTIHAGAATPVTVAADVTGIDIQFPETFTLSGVVVDDIGDPVGDMSLSACAVGGGGCANATSDGTGAFEITTLVAETYTVYEQDFSNLHLSGYYAGENAFSASTGTGVAVPGALIHLLAVAAPFVGGTITDTASHGLTGVTVSLCDTDELNCFEATTDDNGAYKVGVPADGTYRARISDNTGTHPSGGYIPQLGTAVVVDPGAARSFVFPGSSVADLVTTLPAGVRIQVSVMSGGALFPDGFVDFCRSEFVCPDGATASPSGVALSPPMFADTYFIRGTADFQSFYWYVGDTNAASATFPGIAVAPLDGQTATITLQLPGAGTPTDAGDPLVPAPVTVALGDGTGATPVSVTFDDVTASGTSSLTTSETGNAPPDGFQLGLPATYYDISTTATVVPPITICISYAGVSYTSEAALRLYHYDASIPKWVDVTTSLNTGTQTICGVSSSLSPFVIVEPVYSFTGFFQPVDNGTLNRAKAGSGIPVKFSLGADFGLAVFAAGYPAVSTITCTDGAVDAIEQTVDVGSSHLMYDAVAKQYVYLFKTSKAWAGTCRRLVLVFNDGTTRSADFQFTR